MFTLWTVPEKKMFTCLTCLTSCAGSFPPESERRKTTQRCLWHPEPCPALRFKECPTARANIRPSCQTAQPPSRVKMVKQVFCAMSLCVPRICVFLFIGLSGDFIVGSHIFHWHVSHSKNTPWNSSCNHYAFVLLESCMYMHKQRKYKISIYTDWHNGVYLIH